MKRKTHSQLVRENMELKAQLSHVYAFADASIEKASTEHLMASGALIQITALGGREIIPPVVIKDGLSPETIACLRRDLVRSFELATAFKPKKEV